MDFYTRHAQTPKNYGGSYTPPDAEDGQEAEKPRKFVLAEKIDEMVKYGLPLVDKFPRRSRKLADIMRDCMMQMIRNVTRLERKYYKKTTLEELDLDLAVLKKFVVLAGDRDYFGKDQAPPLSMHQREVWSTYNKEIGNMIGGYKKAFDSKAGGGK